MPLGTLDRTPPPFFKQGPSALSKLMLCSALALLLMVADARFKVAQPLRSAVAAVLYPIQWLVLQPVHLGRSAGSYLDALHSAQQREREALVRLADQGQRAAQVEQLTLENERLRQLLSLRASLKVQSQAAEVLYDAADPYVRRVIVDRGQLAGVAAGAPVLDEAGVLGQVTRVYPMVSEVTLVVDRDHAIPVMNARTGVRSVAFGDGGADGGGLDLKFMAAHADVQKGDLLVTSGVDAVYPAGLPVARVELVERRADSAFVRIHCVPVARVGASRHVMVLTVNKEALPERPPVPPPAPAGKKGPGRS